MSLIPFGIIPFQIWPARIVCLLDHSICLHTQKSNKKTGQHLCKYINHYRHSIGQRKHYFQTFYFTNCSASCNLNNICNENCGRRVERVALSLLFKTSKVWNVFRSNTCIDKDVHTDRFTLTITQLNLGHCAYALHAIFGAKNEKRTHENETMNERMIEWIRKKE